MRRRCRKPSGALSEQADAGVDVVSDGEYGKSLGWEQYALERMEGFGPRQELAEGIYPSVDPSRYTGLHARERGRRAGGCEHCWRNVGITQIVFRAGFNITTHFGHAFRERFGVTPREWRRA